MSNPEISQLSETYQSLRQRKGHFDNGEKDHDCDDFNGKKHQVMKKLEKAFGKEGTPANEILEKLGKPDRMEQTLPEVEREEMLKGGEDNPKEANIIAGNMAPLAQAPGPFLGQGGSSGDPNGSYYLAYNWRGNHDYMYFKVNAQTEKVMSSGWYYALE